MPFIPILLGGAATGAGYWASSYWNERYWAPRYWHPEMPEGEGYWTGSYWHPNYWAPRYWHPGVTGSVTAGVAARIGTMYRGLFGGPGKMGGQ